LFIVNYLDGEARVTSTTAAIAAIDALKVFDA
jgi:hypothetical protein